jgi:RNA polymerase sigma factor (TIGR02999 family)
VASQEWAVLVRQADAGEAGAKERLFAALYDELHRLAERQLRARTSISISPTTLLHETYLSLAHNQAAFPDQARFLSYAARAMRSLIIDFARVQRAQKRGGQFHITGLNTRTVEAVRDQPSEDGRLEALSGALDELAAHEPHLAEVVDLKYFGGLSLAEIAVLRGVSERTMQRDWDKARIFLRERLASDQV